jgi:hypothetical protein
MAASHARAEMSKAAELPGRARTPELPTPSEWTHRAASSESTAVTVSAELTHRTRTAESTAVTVSAEFTLRSVDAETTAVALASEFTLRSRPAEPAGSSFRSLTFTLTATAHPTATFHNSPEPFECFPAQRTLL